MTQRDGEGNDQLQRGIERIRRLTQRISEAHALVAANNMMLEHDRNLIRFGPLHDVRDFRAAAPPAGSDAEPSGESDRRRASRYGRRR